MELSYLTPTKEYAFTEGANIIPLGDFPARFLSMAEAMQAAYANGYVVDDWGLVTKAA